MRLGLKYTSQAKVRSSNTMTSRTIRTLHITVHQAEDLTIMDEHGLTDATVKMASKSVVNRITGNLQLTAFSSRILLTPNQY